MISLTACTRALVAIAWVALSIFLAKAIIVLLGTSGTLKVMQTWPLYAALVGLWIPVFVKTFDVGKSEVLPRHMRSAFTGSLKRIRTQIWMLACLSLVTWLSAIIVSNMPPDHPAFPPAMLASITLLLVAVTAFALFPSLLHRLDDARTYLAEQERAEKAREKLLKRMSDAQAKGYTSIEVYANYNKQWHPPERRQ